MKKTDQILKEGTIYEGVPLLAVAPGSTSEKAGMKRGDIIININDQEIKTLDDYLKIVHTRKDSMKVIFVRDGQEMTTTIGLEKVPREVLDRMVVDSGLDSVSKDDEPTLN